MRQVVCRGEGEVGLTGGPTEHPFFNILYTLYQKVFTLGGPEPLYIPPPLLRITAITNCYAAMLLCHMWGHQC